VLHAILRHRPAVVALGAFVAATSVTLCTLAVPAQSAYPGANGRIAYESAVTGNEEIFVMNPDGSGQMDLSNNPEPDRDPSWSPNGARIAFSRTGSTSPDAHANVWLMNADGSGQVNLTPGANNGQGNTGTEPTWSPDGTKIAYIDNSNIWVMNADGTGKVLLTLDAGQAETSPAWSPDGTKIAFVERSDIWVMNATGGGETQLTSTAGAAERSPDWSPDGLKIAYGRGGQIWSMNSDGSGQAALTGGAGEGGALPAWSPGGAKIVFASNAFTAPMGYDIFVMNTDGTEVTRLDTPVPADDLDPNWQPLSAVGYARPKAATPLNFRLVPAFNECPASTPTGMTHAGPLAAPSCQPPPASSAYLTMNAPERTDPYLGAADGTGLVTLKVTCLVPGTTTQVTGPGANPPCSEAGDQIDVRINNTSTGIRCQAVSGGCATAGGLYAGKVMPGMTLRMTDFLNGSGQTSPGTAEDYPLRWGIQCSGGACSLVTSADMIVPGIAVEGKRSVWEIRDVEVLDGGSDGDLVSAPLPASGACPPACEGNDTESVFLHQGLFVP
jgi:Tol biopolymer transport system component